ncbi:hypothetical protein [Pseudophaeobacter sp.]|uniref:hypothetical protein n=1 Tax=Pseudophaeobacter sp. TaxID=1971739 RepID=UPI003297E719
MSFQTHLCAALATILTWAGATTSVQAGEPAAAPALPLTYETFEAAVAHIDLETCPVSLPQADSFCRASIHHEEIHVFAFSLQGDSPMVGFASFSAKGLEPLLK